MKYVTFFLFLTHGYFMSLTAISQNTYADIIPILHKKCAPCHRDGGGAPFSVLNFDEVYSNLAAIYHEVSEGSMPPWAADTSYVHFINERVLTENEKAALVSFLAAACHTQILPRSSFYKYQCSYCRRAILLGKNNPN